MDWRRAATRAMDLDPEDGEACYQRALARIKQGRYAEALADCNEALRRDPEDPAAYQTRSAAYVGLGQFERTMEDLDRVFAENEAGAEAHYLRGRVWVGRGNLAGPSPISHARWGSSRLWRRSTITSDSPTSSPATWKPRTGNWQRHFNSIRTSRGRNRSNRRV